jgi:hypothetical protein
MLNQLGARSGAVPMLGTSAVPSNVSPTTDLVPLNLHLFILPDTQPEKVGALFVPPIEKQSCAGTVIASSSTLAAPGDRVVYSGFWPFEFEGKTHVAVLEKHLVGVRKAPARSTMDELIANGHVLDGLSCRCGAMQGDAASRVKCPLAASPDSTAGA